MKHDPLFRLISFMNCLLITLVCTAQNHQEHYLEEVVENLSVNNAVEETDWEEELEELSDSLRKPLNLNTITRGQLERFPFLSADQIEHLLAYLYLHRPMRTIYELQLVEGMDRKTIAHLLPYICVDVINSKESIRLKTLLKDAVKYGRHEYLTRLDIPFYKRKGYEQDYYGSPVYNSLKYTFHYRENLRMGLAAEKDAGEPFGAMRNKKGYDFYSFYLLINEMNRLKTLCVGSYRLNFGQGLVFGDGFLTGKTTTLSLFSFQNAEIKRHASTDECHYFQGVAAAVHTSKATTLSAFYSYRLLDGAVHNGLITSLQNTGWHRTKKEMNRKGTVAQQLTGTHLSYQQGVLKLGATAAYYWYNRPYEPLLRSYSKYHLRGQRFFNGSVDYAYRWRRLSCQGEVALGKHGGLATVHFLRYADPLGNKLMLVHRYYAYNYWALFGRAFGEGTTVQNENGWYLAGECVPWPRTLLFISADFFAFPWKTYQTNKSSHGMDFCFQMSYAPQASTHMYFRYRFKRKERNLPGTSGEVVLPIYTHQWRYRLAYDTHRWLATRTTCEVNQFHYQGRPLSYGYQLSQSFRCHWAGFPLRLEAQATFFQTDNYDTRVYAFEKGLLYTWYVPSFSGKGSRYSLHFRYDINAHWICLLKFGETIYADRQVIGSGSDEIKGNKKGDLQMQLRLKF